MYAAVFPVLFRQQGPSRKDLQNFECFVDLLTASVWNVLLGSQPFQSKFVALMLHLEKLGLRNPSEHTFASMAAVLLIACQRSGVDRAVVTHTLVQTYFDQCKKFWRTPSYAKRRVAPPELVPILPPTADELQRRWPLVHSQAFQAESPSVAAVPLIEVQTVSRLVQCRGRQQNHGGSISMLAATGSLGAAPPPSEPLPLTLPTFGQPSAASAGELAEPAVAALAAQPSIAAEAPPATAEQPPRTQKGRWQNPAIEALQAPAAAGEAPGGARSVPTLPAHDVVVLDSDGEEALDAPVAASRGAAQAPGAPKAAAPTTAAGGGPKRTPSEAAMTMLAAVRKRTTSGWSGKDEKDKKKLKAANAAAADKADARAAAAEAACPAGAQAAVGPKAKGRKKGEKGVQKGVQKGEQKDVQKGGQRSAVAADASGRGLQKPRYEVTMTRSIVHGLKRSSPRVGSRSGGSWVWRGWSCVCGCLSVCLSACLPACLPVCLSVCVCVFSPGGGDCSHARGLPTFAP